MSASDGFVVCRESFAAQLDGAPVVVRRGENVAADHVLAREHPEKFDALPAATRFMTTEQATAAPGEKRMVGRRPAKTTGGS